MQDFLVWCLCAFLSIYHAAVVVVIPSFDKFDFQTKVRRSKIKELFFPLRDKTTGTTSPLP